MTNTNFEFIFIRWHMVLPQKYLREFIFFLALMLTSSGFGFELKENIMPGDYVSYDYISSFGEFENEANFDVVFSISF